MSRLLDSSICPDCRSPLDERSTCTGCSLVVAGPLASELWSVMVRANGLVERLRDASLSPVTTGSAAHTSLIGAAAPGAMPPLAPRAVRKRMLPAASVPVVLLSLGALCLLVAAAVFVTVSWNDLGLAAKTVILLGVTGLFAGSGTFLTMRGLRGSAEALWLVTSGMLAVDLVSAHSAGLLGLDGLSWRGTSAIVGLALLVMGVGVGQWARTQPVTRLYGVQGVAVLGALLVTAANAWGGAHSEGLDTAVAIPLLVGVALLLRRSLPVTAYGVGGIALLSWAVLVGIGMDRATSTTPTQWYLHGDCWPLLVAAGYTAAIALVTQLPPLARTIAAGASLAVLAFVADGISAGPTRHLLIGAGIVLALALLSRFAPTVWNRAAGALTAVGLLVFAAMDVLRPLAAVIHAIDPLTRSRLGLTVTAHGHEFGPVAWTAVVPAVVTLVAAWGLLGHLAGGWAARGRLLVEAAAPGVLGLGLATYAVEAGLPLWAPVVALVASGLVSAAAAARHQADDLGLVTATILSAYPFLLALVLADPSYLLAAAGGTLITAVAVLGYARLRAGAVGGTALTVLAVGSTLAASYAVIACGRYADLTNDTRLVVLAAVVGLVGVAAGRVARDRASRIGVEVAALSIGTLAAVLTDRETSAAMVVTIVGTAICLVAATNRDRDLVSWGGAVVLCIATLMRIDMHVHAPELYTLPAALLLVGVGIRRLLSDEDVDSVTALGSGLLLGLLPSLVLALDEPVSLRGALVGAAGLGVLAVGVVRHWSAPFVAGASVTALLAIRHLAPVADAVPRWISLGTVGVALLLVGVTWEQRRRNVAGASRYLAALR